MSLLEHLREERYKIILASATSAIGFFLALLANSVLERNHDREAFKSIQEAMRVEASANRDVLLTGFKRFYKDGIVFQQFNTSTSSSFLASTIFLKFSSPSDVANLSTYIRELTLSNRYREKVEVLRLEGKNEALAEHIVNSWATNLDRVDKAINAVQAISPKSAN